jgi:hypothetical protein
MYNFIAASFFRRKSCVLPGIGKLSLVTYPASGDFSNKQILAPVQEIIFTPVSSGENLFNEFSAMSELIKKRLEETGVVDLAGIGVFTKKDADEIKFTPVQLDENIQAPVTAVRVIRQRSEHAMLVGDKETTNTQMSELLNEEEAPAKSKWWMWAAILGATGLILLAIYLSQHGTNSFGNVAP